MMIIRTPRSLPGQLIDSLLTALAWTVFLYLLVSGIRSALTAPAADHAAPAVVRLLTDAHALLVYPSVSICIGLLLYSWASYNAWRFSHADRRKTQTALTDWALAASFRLNPAQVADLHASRNIRMHHAQDGQISRMALDEQSCTRSVPAIHLAAWR
ncbi:poly-beta-1,6-N-acetyl-D-glucosamine biosynthesis protein PgaD [Castellaniella sp.]|uniref:poly-beta-1,6-N-acetyl-D-glucosamine biosynthesis protein PgaD n=1 Tax=Castellaniella sp. TaxID=1955812 RepID=UPI003C735EC8